MNLVFLPLKSLILTTIFNVCFRTDTSHLKSISCLGVLSFSHTNSLTDYLLPHLRLQLSKKPTPFPFSILMCFLYFSFFFLLHFHFLYYRVFSSLFDSLWPCVRESFLLLQFRQTLRAAEVGGNYSCPWRLCRLPRKTKKKIFQQQVAAWVSTYELPAQPTLGNLAYSIFLPADYSFSSPMLQPPGDRFPKLQCTRSNRFLGTQIQHII